jgi:hypothetical protein
MKDDCMYPVPNTPYLTKDFVLLGYVPTGARSAATKPHPLWLPSQKGLFFDWPQRQRATAGLSAGSLNWVPAASTTVMGPWTRSGPLSRMVMIVGMEFPVAEVVTDRVEAETKRARTPLPHLKIPLTSFLRRRA